MTVSLRILLGDPELPENLKTFLLRSHMRGIHSPNAWYATAVANHSVVAIPSRPGSLDQIVATITRSQNMPRCTFATHEQLLRTPPADFDAYVINGSSSEQLLSVIGKQLKPVLELAKPWQRRGEGSIPLYEASPHVIRKTLARAMDIAPLYLVSKELGHAERLAALLENMSTYFSPHVLSVSAFIQQPHEKIKSGVVVYAENPTWEDCSFGDLSKVMSARAPVIYFRPQTFWRQHVLDKLLRDGLFDFVHGSVQKYLASPLPFWKPGEHVSIRRLPPQRAELAEMEEELLVTLEQLTNAVHAAFETRKVFDRSPSEAFELTRKKMPYLFIHAPRRSASKMRQEITLQQGAMVLDSNLEKGHVSIFDESSLEEAYRIADAWKPNIVYVQLGRNPSQGGVNTRNNLHVLDRLRKLLPNTRVWLSYDAQDQDLERVLRNLQSRDHTITTNRHPVWPVIWRTWPLVWNAYLASVSGIQRTESLRKHRAILDTCPEELEDLLSQRFVEPEPEPQYRAKPAYPGAATGRLFIDLEDALEAKIKRDNVLFYVEDISKLGMNDVRKLRGLDGIIFKHVSHENHYTIDLQRSGVPMIRVSDDLSVKKGIPVIAPSTTFRLKDFTFYSSDYIAFNGNTGNLFKGKHAIKPSLINPETLPSDTSPDAMKYKGLLELADKILQEGKIDMMINADTVEAIQEARKWGVGSVGLVRSENVLREQERRLRAYGELMLALLSLQELQNDEHELHKNNQPYESLLSDGAALVKVKRDEFEREQAEAFYGILKCQTGRVTQVRLLDPPMYDLFKQNDVATMSDAINTGLRKEGKAEHYASGKLAFLDLLKDRSLRGARLLRWPDIYEGQIRALFRAYDQVRQEGIREPELRIFIPYVEETAQVEHVKRIMSQVNERVYGSSLQKLVDQHGVTLETPGGCSCAKDMFLKVGTRYFALGTNDLFPLVDGTVDRERGGTQYSYTRRASDGTPLLSEGILNVIDDTIRDLDWATKKKNNGHGYVIGLCGELNEVKLHHLNLGRYLPKIKYVSAGRPKQVPLLKVLVAQGYLRAQGIS
jgi:hypothetical protein